MKKNEDYIELICSLKKNDHKTQIKVINQYWEGFKAYLLANGIHNIYIDDILNRSFYKAFIKIDSFTGTMKPQFINWLKSIVRYEMLNTLTTNKRYKEVLDSYDVESTVTPESTIDYEIILNMVSGAKFSEKQKKVFDLYILGLRPIEIAEKLGISATIVRGSLHEVKIKAKKQIDKLYANGQL